MEIIHCTEHLVSLRVCGGTWVMERDAEAYTSAKQTQKATQTPFSYSCAAFASSLVASLTPITCVRSCNVPDNSDSLSSIRWNRSSSPLTNPGDPTSGVGSAMPFPFLRSLLVMWASPPDAASPYKSTGVSARLVPLKELCCYNPRKKDTYISTDFWWGEDFNKFVVLLHYFSNMPRSLPSTIHFLDILDKVCYKTTN